MQLNISNKPQQEQTKGGRRVCKKLIKENSCSLKLRLGEECEGGSSQLAGNVPSIK